MRQEKIQIGNDIAAMLTSSDFVYFVSYKGLSTAEMNNFRDKLYAAGANCHVLKNRVVRKVAELNGLEALANTKIVGDTAVVVGNGDASAVAKVITEFTASTKEVLAPKCGYFEGAMLSAAEIKAIADLPSKDALRAQLLGLLNAVPTGLVRVLSAKAGSIINVINAYKNKLEEAK
ncbi:MAG: 50S ribosomal protein L10 [Lentisphaeria bacterium]|jgi:large subunit ribosomal protein L10|nr:50S ribosomal protein L10 [Lentisphaeria bacterium]